MTIHLANDLPLFHASQFMRSPDWPDVLDVLPELADSQRTAYRCNLIPPTDDAVNSSNMGGDFLWPLKQQWPTCGECRAANGAVNYLTPVIQVFRDDAPDFWFPNGKDLFQLMWCGRNHEPSYSVAPYVFWHKQNSIKKARSEFPKPNPEYPYSELQRSGLSFQAVHEFPHWESLTVDQQHRLKSWNDPKLSKCFDALPEYASCNRDAYEQELSAAPGMKLGGFPRWIQKARWDPWWSSPMCERGHEMDHLVTLAWGECHRSKKSRWYDPANGEFDSRWPLGDLQMLIFTCRECDDHPIQYTLDS